MSDQTDKPTPKAEQPAKKAPSKPKSPVKAAGKTPAEPVPVKARARSKPDKPAGAKPAPAKSQPKQKGKRGGGRKPHATRPTAAEEVEILERQEMVYELRKGGASFPKIAKHLKAAGVRRASVGTVHADYAAYRDRKRALIQLGVDDMIDHALENLDDLQLVVLARAKKFGKKDDVMSYLAIDKRRDEYLGLSKAQRSENKAREVLAQLLGIEPDQIPDASGDSKK